jgi:flavoprotein
MSDKLVEYCPICEKPINQKDDKHLDICKGCQNNMYNTVCQNDKFNKRKK